MGLEKRKERTLKFMDDRHWDLFAEFTELEMASGGPDPHVAFVGFLAKGCPIDEKLWRCGCYISAYNVASAEIIWRDWPWPKVYDESMLPWFEEHWKGITTRTERKGVRIKENMVTYFETYANWMDTLLAGEKKYIDDPNLSPVERYELLWDDIINDVKFFGRYVGVKALEYFKRYCGFDIELPDIRPVDGWSPRTTMSLLFPDRIDYLLSTDSKENMAVIKETTEETLHILKEEYGIPQLDMFVLEVVLCNYRQSYVGNKLYPGRTHDTELRYLNKLLPHWLAKDKSYTDSLQFFDVREDIFPEEHLSEFNNWDEVRSKDIGCLTREGFVWSDLLYDYDATLKQGGDFLGDPVVRDDGEERIEYGFKLREFALKYDDGNLLQSNGKSKAAKVLIDLDNLPKTNAKLLPISDGELYQRSCFIDMPLDKKLAMLVKYDVDIVVNLWHTADVELEPYLFKYYHHYFPDSEKEFPEEFLLSLAAELAELIDAGHVVLVHCYGGNNRSSLLNVLIMRELYEDMTGSDAMEIIRNVKQRALHNKLYERYLDQLGLL